MSLTTSCTRTGCIVRKDLSEGQLTNPYESESFMDDSNFKLFQNLSSERRNIAGFQKGLFWYCRGNFRFFLLIC